MGKDKNEDPSLTPKQREEIKKAKREQLKKKLLALYDDQDGKALSDIEVI
jgi:hypothetical protein